MPHDFVASKAWQLSHANELEYGGAEHGTGGCCNAVTCVAARACLHHQCVPCMTAGLLILV
jgi:hypothetical protein